MRVYSNFRHTMSWSITQFNFGTNPYFTHAPGIAIRCEPTGSLPHCAGVANDCYCWSCFLNGDEIPTAIEHHKNLQDVRDVCACQKFVEWGMRYALRILGASISLHWFVASTGCPVGLESAWAKRPASAGATGLWIWLGQARDAGLQRKNRWKDWRSSLEKNHWDDRSWNTAMLQCCWGILLSLSKSILIAGILIAIYHPCIKSDFRYDLGSHWAWPPGGLASGSRWSLASLKVDEEAGKCWTWGQPWQKGMAAPKFWSFHVICMISFIFILGSENTWTKY